MNFLKNLFQIESEKESAAKFNWLNLQNLDHLNDLHATSFQHPQVIFKHSTNCGISSLIRRSFEKEENHPKTGITYHLLDLIAFRTISNTVAEKYDVRHESPQVLVIKEGRVVAHASHSGIDAIDLRAFL